MKPLRLIATLCAAVVIMAAALTVYVLKLPHPDPAWQKHLNEFSQADVLLLKGGADEVVMVWSPQPNWTANVTINLEDKTMLGGAGNGVSYSAPYPDAKPNGNPLTDDQILRIHQTLAQLPEGVRVDEQSDFFHDFRIAYFHNGTRIIRHYPSRRLPQPLKEIGEALYLWLPQQAQE